MFPKSSRKPIPVCMLKFLKHFNLPTNDLLTIYSGFVRPTSEYGALVWRSGITADESQKGNIMLLLTFQGIVDHILEEK